MTGLIFVGIGIVFMVVIVYHGGIVRINRYKPLGLRQFSSL